MPTKLAGPTLIRIGKSQAHTCKVCEVKILPLILYEPNLSSKIGISIISLNEIMEMSNDVTVTIKG